MLITLATGETRKVTTVYPDGHHSCPWCGDNLATADRCPNPGCLRNLPAGEVRARQAAHARRDSAAATRQRAADAARAAADESGRERTREWVRLATVAQQRGACMQCLNDSFSKGRPRLVRHRTPDFHTR